VSLVSKSGLCDFRRETNFSLRIKLEMDRKYYPLFESKSTVNHLFSFILFIIQSFKNVIISF